MKAFLHFQNDYSRSFLCICIVLKKLKYRGTIQSFCFKNLGPVQTSNFSRAEPNSFNWVHEKIDV